jgi:hypothetical protein
MVFKNLLIVLSKGFILSLLYLEITKANDTNLKNIFLFISFYTLMFIGASIVDIDPNVVTTAFITKTIFTLVDERVKRKEESK